MFRGILLIFTFTFVSTSAYCVTCQMVFQPLKLIKPTSTITDTYEQREINAEIIALMTNEGIITSDIELLKLRRLAAESPFIYEAFHNITQSTRHLEEVVEQNLLLQMHEIEMDYASGSSQVYAQKKIHTTAQNNLKNNSKVVILSEVREKKDREEEEAIEAEKADFKTIVREEFSELNYGFFHQLHDLFSVINVKLNHSETVKLSAAEYNTLKQIADNFKVYTNYLMAKEILQTFRNSSEESILQITAVITRDPNLHEKFTEYLSYIDKTLQNQRMDVVLSSTTVERAQKQLLEDVKAVHLEGSEKHFADIIKFMEGRIDD